MGRRMSVVYSEVVHKLHRGIGFGFNTTARNVFTTCLHVLIFLTVMCMSGLFRVTS